VKSNLDDDRLLLRIIRNEGPRVFAMHRPNSDLGLLAVLLIALVVTVGLALSPSQVFSADTGNVRDEYVVVKPDIGGPGYDQFYPQTLIVGQGDQVNLVVRNTDTQGFSLKIEDIATATIQPGVSTSGGIMPVDTKVPPFEANKTGIFTFAAVEHSEMNGYLVVLPSNWSEYAPSPTDRKFTLLAIPDFAGDAYDKFFPETVVVNQGDHVNISIRNLDAMPHGFAIAAYGIDVAVNPAQQLPNGTATPTITEVPTFAASSPGVFLFICTVPCGGGHQEMVGTIIVLPRAGNGYNPDPTTSYNYLVVKPDFAGDGYDKFLPATIIVNQGDLVYIKVRNTDVNPHGFTLPGFNVNNETIAPATESGNKTIPTDTFLTPFFANRPGVYEFFCSIPCGPGHDQMIGYLVVLPRLSEGAPPPASGIAGGIPLEIAALVSFGMIIVGFVAGLVVATRFGVRKDPEH
jgi:heme/copper-type cytochrome/quinol oxidase subunit 2